MKPAIRRLAPLLILAVVLLVGQMVRSQGADDASIATDGASSSTQPSTSLAVEDRAEATDTENAEQTDDAEAADEHVPVSNLPTIDPGQLPPEAIDTIVLIDSGGPFPFDRDDLTFENREGLLPDRPLGHYREYTVITPGENTRGARRIVAGDDGELYYTADHYRSFEEVTLTL